MKTYLDRSERRLRGGGSVHLSVPPVRAARWHPGAERRRFRSCCHPLCIALRRRYVLVGLTSMFSRSRVAAAGAGLAALTSLPLASAERLGRNTVPALPAVSAVGTARPPCAPVLDATGRPMSRELAHTPSRRP